MSSTGWAVVRHIDTREERERERLRQLYLESLRRKLTVEEKGKVRDGDLPTLTRDRKPEWKAGDWLPVGPQLHVRIGTVSYQKSNGIWVSTTDKVSDDRTGGRVTGKRTRELMPVDSTIVPLGDGPHFQPEPARVPDSVVKDLPSSIDARKNYAELHAEDAERRYKRAFIEELRGADLTVEDLVQIRAVVQRIRQARQVAA